MLDPSKPQCSLLLFMATPAEMAALKETVIAHHLPFERHKLAGLNEYYHWLGPVGNETAVIAVGPS
jgi:hypothetical protein